MAHTADFHGNQLRLSAILRVVGKVPPPPKRLQRNRQAPLSPLQEESANATRPPTMGLVPFVELAQEDSSKTADETMLGFALYVQPVEHDSNDHPFKACPASVGEELASRVHPLTTGSVPLTELAQDGGSELSYDAMQELDPCVQSAEQDSGPKDGSPFGTRAAPGATGPPEIHDQARSDMVERDMDVPVVSSKNQKKVVYTAEKKQSRPPVGVLNARKKHHLPSENGLVFVRASTKDGLPLPGDAEILFARQIAETDPIQDSQLGHLPNRLRKLSADAGKKPPDSWKKPRVARSPMIASCRAKAVRVPNSEPFAYRGSMFLRPHAQTRRQKGATISGLGTSCDGFVGQEMFVPERHTKTRTRIKKKHTDTPIVEDDVNEGKGVLQLAKGFLPVPCPVSSTSLQANGTPFHDVGSQLKLVHPSVKTDFDELRQDSVDLPLRRKMTPVAIRTQLSGITAPVREDEESESSSDPDSEADISGWGVEDTPEFDAWRLGLALDVIEMGGSRTGRVWHG